MTKKAIRLSLFTTQVAVLAKKHGALLITNIEYYAVLDRLQKEFIKNLK